MFCPQCHAEYRAGVTRCADCGVDLVDDEPVEGHRGSQGHTELVVVGTYHSEFEAHIAESALAAAGIEATVGGDDAGGAYPVLGFTQGIALLTRAEDAVEAREILRAEAPDAG